MGFASPVILQIDLWDLGQSRKCSCEFQSGKRYGSRVGGVDVDFLVHSHPPIPAAITLLLLDAGVVPGLVARVAKVGQHIRPEALVL